MSGASRERLVREDPIPIIHCRFTPRDGSGLSAWSASSRLPPLRNRARVCF